MNKTQMVDKSNFNIEQYKADLQSAYDCGYVAGAIAELEKLRSEINCKYMNNYIYSVVTVVCILNDLDKRIAELKGEVDRRNIIEKPFSRTDDCLSYEESFCEARDCGECCCREVV